MLARADDGLMATRGRPREFRSCLLAADGLGSLDGAAAQR